MPDRNPASLCRGQSDAPREGPMVRILFPPAGSLVRTLFSGTNPVNDCRGFRQRRPSASAALCARSQGDHGRSWTSRRGRTTISGAHPHRHPARWAGLPARPDQGMVDANCGANGWAMTPRGHWLRQLDVRMSGHPVDRLAERGSLLSMRCRACGCGLLRRVI